MSDTSFHEKIAFQSIDSIGFVIRAKKQTGFPVACFFADASMCFPFLEGMAARIGHVSRVIRVSAVHLFAADFLRQVLVRVPVDLDHDRLGAAVVARFPILAIVDAAFHHRICHIITS
jgi:hypothetical protein